MGEFKGGSTVGGYLILTRANLSNDNPQNLGSSISPGTSVSISRSDHIHKIPTLADVTSQGSTTSTGATFGGTVTWPSGNSVNANSAYTHISSDGSSHTFINQNVTTTASPTFASLTINGNISSTGSMTWSGGNSTNANTAYTHSQNNTGSVHGATNANTVNMIVKRDASGNFSAGTITASLSGNASTATKLQTARNFSISGDVSATAVSFDGSGNINLSTVLGNTGVTAGNYSKVTVDTKGRVISGTALTSEDIPIISTGQISGLGTAAIKDVGTAAGNVPVLDSNGKIDAIVLPAIAITDTYVVASQTAMLALTVQTGDVAIRSDLHKSYILQGTDPTILASWQELQTPTDLVQSVNGKTGTVTLTASDVGLGNVTNESKATMFTNAALTGVPTAPTASASTNNTQIATTAYVKSQGYITSYTNNYLTGVSGSGNSTVTFTRQGLGNLTWNAAHTHAGADITSAVANATNSDKVDNCHVNDSTINTSSLWTSDKITSYVNASINYLVFKSEEFVVTTTNQTLFTLTKGTYQPGSGRMSVYLFGIKQPPTAFTETSSTSVTLNAGVEIDTRVLFEWYEIVSGALGYPTHGSTHVSGGGDAIPNATATSSGLMSATSFNLLSNLQNKVVDNAASIFVQEPEPTAIYAGQFWLNISTGVLKIWTGSIWQGVNTYT